MATSDKIQVIRDQLLTRGLKAAAVLGFFTLAGSLSRIWFGGWHALMYLHIAIYVILLFLAVGGHYLSYYLRAGVITGITLVLGIGLLVGGGFASFGLLSLFCFCVLSTILFNSRAGIISCLLCLGIVASIGVCVHIGVLSFEPTIYLELNSSVLWVTAVFAFALTVGIIVVFLGVMNRQLEKLVNTLHEQKEEIRKKNKSLEHEIAERDRVEKERIILKDKLQLAKKMEAVGKLAGGVAHDLNNTLGSIIGYPDLVLNDLPSDSPLREPIERIKKTGIKAATIVGDMLTLARRGIVTTDVFDLNSVINEYLKSPEFDQLMAFHKEVQIEIQTHKTPLNVQGSFFHLSKVITNLVSNAAEAMPDGGSILIETEKQYIDESNRVDELIKPGAYSVLHISDTGIGIPKDDLEKIYEPFYTKKKMGRSGTGLGMSVVWSSIKDHKGHISVESAEGKGTKFSVYLPFSTEEATVLTSSFSKNDISGQGESILVVDDVMEQREIAVNLLTRMGYSVHAVGSGEEALEYLQHDSADLLILDMIMDPGMDGLDTYKKVLDKYPKQKAIVFSGYSETSRVKEALSLGAGAYLKKPFGYSQMGYLVRTELDKRREMTAKRN